MLCAQQPTSSISPEKQAKPDDTPCGMIYGKDHFLSVCSPRGWVFDNGNPAMARNGVFATFYRTEFTFEEAMARHTIMYVNVVPKAEGQQSASELMKEDLENTKRKSPNMAIEPAKPIVIPADKGTASIQVPVQTYLNDYRGGYESVAYVENDKTIAMIVISSVSNDLLRQDYPDFVVLVQSYRFFGSNVTIHK
jgi:hypothetical protein